MFVVLNMYVKGVLFGGKHKEKGHEVFWGTEDERDWQLLDMMIFRIFFFFALCWANHQEKSKQINVMFIWSLWHIVTNTIPFMVNGKKHPITVKVSAVQIISFSTLPAYTARCTGHWRPSRTPAASLVRTSLRLQLQFSIAFYILLMPCPRSSDRFSSPTYQ